MKEFTCIICPIGCSLRAEFKGENPAEGILVTGNRCPRGAAYAREELSAPKRTVTATCRIAALDSAFPVRRLPVKTSSACPREKIPALLKDLYQLEVTLPVKAGTVLLPNWQDTGINIVATRSIE
jgi:CxxC motif-containing protein